MSKFVKVLSALSKALPIVKTAVLYAKGASSSTEYKHKDKVEKALDKALIVTEVASVVVEKVEKVNPK